MMFLATVHIVLLPNPHHTQLAAMALNCQAAKKAPILLTRARRPHYGDSNVQFAYNRACQFQPQYIMHGLRRVPYINIANGG